MVNPIGVAILFIVDLRQFSDVQEIGLPYQS